MATVRVLDLPKGVVQAGAATRGAFDFRKPIDLSGAAAAAALPTSLPGGFELVETVTFEASPTIPLRAFSPGQGEANVEVAVEDGFEVVGLTITDGVPRWDLPVALPAGAATRDATGLGVRRLRVSLASRPDGTRGLFDGLVGKVVTHVLKFVARKAAAALIGELVERHEADLREGPVLFTEGAATAWEAVEELTGRVKPNRRVLVMVHGTFSSTLGSFGALASGDGSPLPRWLDTYGAVIGFDHHTLSRSPRENAEAIAAHLRKLPQDVTFDIVGYSRGGLVVRELTAQVFDAAERDRVETVVGVATTYQGTRLARQARWGQLLDRMTTLASVVSVASGATGAGALLGTLATGFGGLLAMVKALSEAALVDGGIPGLAAMDPDGDVIKALAKAPSPAAQRYLTITSDFEPPAEGLPGLPTKLGFALADAAVDGLFEGAPNDLVVDNASTLGLPDAFPKDPPFAVPTAAGVHHVAFFGNDAVRRKLGLVLTSAGPGLTRFSLSGTTENTGTGGTRSLPVGFGGAESPVGVDEPGTPAAAPITLHLGADAPRAVEQGSIFQVGVKVGREQIVVSDGGQTTVLKSAQEALPLTILVRPTRGCRLAAGTTGRVERPVPPPGDPIDLEFDLEAVDLGPASIEVLVRQGNDKLGGVTLTPRVRVEGRADPVREVVPATSALDRGSPSAHVLDVTYETVGGEHVLRFDLRSPSNNVNRRYDPWKIGTGPLAYVNGVYKRIEEAWAQQPDPAKFQRMLDGLGIELWEALFPPKLRDDLWALRGKVDGLQIDSNESILPWEMVRVSDPADSSQSGGFLAEWGLVRALVNTQTPDALRLQPAGVVRPVYPGQLALPAAAQEETFLAQALGAKSLPAREGDLFEWFQKREPIGVFHYAGHGQADEEDLRLVLAGSTTAASFSAELLDASAFKGWPKFASTPSRPLVFINACRTGQTQMVLAAERSWARVFLDKGAGAVITPLWAVGDGAATTFATTLYEKLQGGATMSAAVTEARKRAREAKDATWLAYTVYATPHATVA